MLEYIWRTFFQLVLMLGLVPVVGGAILWQVFPLARITQFTFAQCWKAYLTGCCWALVLVIGLRYVWRGSADSFVLPIGIFVLTTVIVVPLILRDRSRRTWLVVGITVPLIDALAIALAMKS